MSTPPDAAGDRERTALLRSRLRAVPDFPRPGITFWDLTPVLADARALVAAVEALAATAPAGVDVVAGVEARGFVLGAPVAVALGAGFVPVRKAGKLPRATVGEDYDLEYGRARVEVHADAVAPGSRVLLVDDLLATGGTAAAAARLLDRLGAEVVAASFLVELADLGGRRALAAAPDLPVHAALRL